MKVVKMSEHLSEFEKQLKAYLLTRPDVIEAMRTGDMGKLNMSDEWKREVEKNDTPENRLIARRAADRALVIVKRRKLRRKIIARTLTASCACLLIFFTLTPTGQAAANGIIETVTTFIGGGIRIETKGAELGQRGIADLKQKEFNNISEAAEYSGQDMIYIDSPDLQIESISVTALDGLNQIITKYILPDKREISTFQYTFSSDTSTASDLDTSYGYTERKLFNGEIMYCINYDDGTYGGVAMWENIQLNIVSEKVPWDEMDKYIDHFTIASSSDSGGKMS
jgi:hypothetical protein